MLNEPKMNGRKSKLDPYCDEILDLHNNGYALDQIIQFLAANDIQTSKTNLFSFIKRRTSQNKPLGNTLESEPSASESKDNHQDGEPIVKQTPKVDSLNKQTNFGHFDWQNKPDTKDFY